LCIKTIVHRDRKHGVRWLKGFAAKKLMRFLPFILGLVCATAAVGCSSASAPRSTTPQSTEPQSARALSGNDEVLARAFKQGTRNLQVEGQGIVRRVLSDDYDGSRHQRFVVALASGQTLIIAHNIDLASRVVGLREGDVVSFSGEYEWNPEGGVIHWTHHDPGRRHPPGWIKHNGKVYQ
jgi:ABC-type glycerol-3-phosphate transport system substrate-binding protein